MQILRQHQNTSQNKKAMSAAMAQSVAKELVADIKTVQQELHSLSSTLTAFMTSAQAEESSSANLIKASKRMKLKSVTKAIKDGKSILMPDQPPGLTNSGVTDDKELTTKGKGN
jgi:hypothetical protein